MKNLIIILSVLLFSCKKECYLIDNIGNKLPFVGDIRSAYSEYISKGKTVINGNTYLKSNNDLIKVCD